MYSLSWLLTVTVTHASQSTHRLPPGSAEQRLHQLEGVFQFPGLPARADTFCASLVIFMSSAELLMPTMLLCMHTNGCHKRHNMLWWVHLQCRADVSDTRSDGAGGLYLSKPSL